MPTDPPDTCFVPLRLALATLQREANVRPDNHHAVTALGHVAAALAVLEAHEPPLPGSTRRPHP